MSFAFGGAEILYSTLGGRGPDVPLGVSAGFTGIRYVNVGTAYDEAGAAVNLDLLLTNQSSYEPFDPALNTLQSGSGVASGGFARINLACNHEVRLRVTITQSCSTGQSCKSCDELYGMVPALRGQCYASGCACFGRTVKAPEQCTGAAKEAAREAYGCAELEKTVVLPRDAMVAMTVYDFDTGPVGDVGASAEDRTRALYRPALCLLCR